MKRLDRHEDELFIAEKQKLKEIIALLGDVMKKAKQIGKHSSLDKLKQKEMSKEAKKISRDMKKIIDDINEAWETKSYRGKKYTLKTL